MSGPLPAELTVLSLEGFRWGGTDLCAPADRVSQEWLRAIPDQKGAGDCDWPESAPPAASVPPPAAITA